MPRPYCATAPDSVRSVTMSTRVPPSISLRLDWIAACAPAAAALLARLGAQGDRPGRLVSASRVTSVAKASEIGPSFTVSFAFQAFSSTVSSSSAPGMQGTTRGTSMQELPGLLARRGHLERVLELHTATAFCGHARGASR